MTHIDPDTAASFAAHALSADERAEVERHIDGCGDCRQLVSTIARVAWSQSGSSDPGASSEGAPPLVLPAGTVVGPFVIERPLDAGGMGLVYCAHDARLERRVALKCVRESRANADQLRREARLMAQLAHPNVVPLYDLVEAFDQVYLAMELVVGRSLRLWMEERPRSWRSIVDVFLEAGAGLAAAHAAGIVHGDVKPANILVGDDGRVRVTDFGLASFATDPGPSGSPGGTPAYAAPEQRRGRACDALSDQYSFCLSLHEAVFGALPSRPPVRAGRLPRGVQRVLTRGLLEDPEARFGSMKTLLLALRAARSSRRWVIAAAVLIAAAVALAYDVGGRRVEVEQCDASAQQLATPWNDETRQAVRTAFLRVKVPYAADTLSHVESSLDEWSKGFEAMRRRACERDWLRREAPLQRFNDQLHCLTESARQGRALVSQLIDADETVVLHAVSATEQLPPVERCTESRPQISAVLPDGPEISQQRDELARARALIDSHRFKEALPVAKAVVARTASLGPIALAAHAKVVLGLIQSRLSDYDAGRASLLEAIRLAEVARADRVVAAAWSGLVSLEYWAGRFDQVVFIRGPALGACERAGEVWHQTEVLLMLGGSLTQLGRPDEAKPLFEQAVELRLALYGPNDRRVAWALSSLGNALSMAGDLDGGIDAHHRSVVAAEASLGRPHPNVAVLHTNLGDDYLYGMQPDAAVAELSAALEIIGEARSREAAGTATDLGLAYLELGHPELALAHFERSAELWQSLSPEHPAYGETLMGRFRALNALGRPADIADLERAVVLGKRLPPFERGRIELALAMALAGAERRPSERAVGLVRTALVGFHATTLPLINRDAALARAWLDARGLPHE